MRQRVGCRAGLVVWVAVGEGKGRLTGEVDDDDDEKSGPAILRLGQQWKLK